MGLWDRIKAFLAAETADIKDELSEIRDSLDTELARKEREQQATPEERVEMIIEEIEEEDAAFEALEDRIRGTAEGEPADGE